MGSRWFALILIAAQCVFSTSCAAMHHASEEGRERMLLETSFGRLPALKLYLNLGFRPVLTDSRHAENWRQVLAKLDYPERFEAVLNGPLVRVGENEPLHMCPPL